MKVTTFPILFIRTVLLICFFLNCPFLSAEAPKKARSKKIALLFLTRQGFNHPELWKSLLIKYSEKFNFYIYSDNILNDPYFNRHRIKKTIPTSWDRHIKTWQLIVTKAFKDKENYKFVYLSESCLPICSLDEIYDKLTENDNSYMCYAGPWWEKTNSREVTALPEEHRWANHEWVILNRRHAEMIVKDNEIIDVVSQFSIDSESYPSTLFSYRGCLHEFVCRISTYVNWSLTEGGGAHPYHFREYNDFNHQMLIVAKKRGCWFVRKFTASFPQDKIKKIMNSPAD